MLLVRVGRRGNEPGGSAAVVLPDHRYPVDTPRQPRIPGWRRSAGRRQAAERYAVGRVTDAEIQALVPVSPAIGPAGAVDADETGLAIPLLPGERTLVRQAKFVVVNACTVASLTLGLFAIFLAMQGDVRLAAGALIACVLFDGLDGALARRMGVASPFGAQMDSLADMCSFGLAAPVVVYASLAGSVSTPAAAVACALVAACAAIRLARFNVSPKDGRFFCGVPTTMAAAVLALAVLIGLPVSGTVQVAGVGLLAFAMVSSFPYAKLARLIKLPPWVWAAPVIGALLDIRLTFALLVIGYLASGPLLWLRERRTA
ncbi:CDP-alcohol phosphatidyltransferase family protein [Solwaraspora sp. WMMD1047]|uniref:CDP-alcohol phosphatidyltransferase family protein n=1 Tax=Solwaraspora sp. WMMD1047 TaxID=3016102 RepID=UPI002417AB37|nr:CDP-alcohol phosphatidyltransferase family protein [Solwaraspora sp. WMMD1047]MDG4828542.1 CDP-alcohol phosphatidyltransferase family protein [Solwaraspora sp. WMMD1047]